MVQEEVAEFQQLPSPRPALIALALVVAVSLAMIGGTCVMVQRASARTSTLVENSLASVQLVGDLRHSVARIDGSSAQRTYFERKIRRDLRAYEPLAVGMDEAVERARLERAVDRFLAEPPGTPDSVAWRTIVQDSLRRLVDINATDAIQTLAEVQDVHWRVVIAQIVAGLLTLGAAAVVAAALTRIIRRQRRLVAHVMGDLRERNTELEAFAPRTAHDLRGPLTPIRGYAELLAQGAPVDVAKAGERIRSATERMAEIIENLLALSISGHPPPGEAQVPPVVRGVLDELAGELAGADVRLSLEDATVACAPPVLRQILHNLLANSSKYRAPDRRLVLEVTARPTDGEVEIVIADNGVGMTREAIAHAFDPYYRFSTSTGIPGLGLGLSIVHRTIHAVGGTCRIESEPGSGTRFVMRLPRARARTAPRPQAAPSI